MMEISNCVGGGVNGHKLKIKDKKSKIFDEIISLENLFTAWQKFRKGKRNKVDVQQFEFNLEENLFQLHHKLKTNTYYHSTYTSFYIQDPKLRHIHKARVEDRIVHRAVVNTIEPIFEKIFIYDSYSSRQDKGAHKANRRFREFAWRLSKNNTKTVWVLKCDIKKFFDSIDHLILIKLIKKRIKDERTTNLIQEIIFSYEASRNKGLPLGNITSQLFANIYLNELDQFVKRELRVKSYVRYADDFIILSGERLYLENLLYKIDEFLRQDLDLYLHPQKIKIKKWRQGVDFLGYVLFPHHTILRTKTKRRILKKIKNKYRDYQNGLISKESFGRILQSYLGILKHCRGHKVKKDILGLCAYKILNICYNISVTCPVAPDKIGDAIGVSE